MSKRANKTTAGKSVTVRALPETSAKLDELKRLTKLSKQNLLDLGINALIERLTKTGVLS